MAKPFVIRKIVFFFPVLFFVQIAQAQIVPGGIYPGVSGNYRIIRYNATGWRPEISVGVSQHLMLGTYFDTHHFRGALVNDSMHYDRLDNCIGITASYFHYLGKKQRWGFMVNSTLSHNFIQPSVRTPTEHYRTATSTELRLSFSPGIFYKASRNLTLFARFGEFSINKPGQGGHFKLSAFQEFRVGLLLNIGNPLKKGR